MSQENLRFSIWSRKQIQEHSHRLVGVFLYPCGDSAPTPCLDTLAAEGMRFKNYNVESQGTPKVTIVERSQLEIEQFLAMLRFENRSKVEELIHV